MTMVVHPPDGKDFEIKLSHTFNEGQIEWFKAGSALNKSGSSSYSFSDDSQLNSFLKWPRITRLKYSCRNDVKAA